MPLCSIASPLTVADRTIVSEDSSHRDRALKLFDQAVEIALSQRGALSRYETLLDIAQKMAKAGEKMRALSILKLAEAEVPNDPIALSEIALQIAKLDREQQAAALFNKAVILQYKYTGKDIYERYSHEKILVEIVKKMAEARQFEAALAVTNKLSDRLRRAEAFNEIATKLITLGKLEQAQSPLSEALKIAQHIREEEAPYFTLGNGSCSIDQFEVLSNIAKNLSLIGQLERALATANKLYPCISVGGQDLHQYRLWAFSGILESLKDSTQIKEVWKSAQKISPEASLDRGYVWDVIASKLVEVHEADLAYNIAQKIATIEFEEGERSDDRLSSQDEIIQILAVKLAKAGKIEEAQRLVTTIRPSGVELEVQAVTLIEMADALDFKAQAISVKALRSQAVALAQRIVPQQIPDESRSPQQLARQVKFRGQLASRLTKQGQIDLALKLCNTFQSSVNREYILSPIAVALADTGSLTRALTLVASIEDVTKKNAVLSDIASSLSTTGNSQLALDIAMKISDKPKQIDTLHKIVPNLKDRNQIEIALSMAQTFLVKSPFDRDQKDLLLVKLAKQFVKIGDISSSIQIAKTSRRASVTIEVAKALANNGNTEEGLLLLSLQTERTADKAMAIAEIASGLIKKQLHPNILPQKEGNT